MVDRNETTPTLTILDDCLRDIYATTTRPRKQRPRRRQLPDVSSSTSRLPTQQQRLPLSLGETSRRRQQQGRARIEEEGSFPQVGSSRSDGHEQLAPYRSDGHERSQRLDGQRRKSTSQASLQRALAGEPEVYVERTRERFSVCAEPPPKPIDITEQEKKANLLIVDIERMFTKDTEAWLARNQTASSTMREKYADQLSDKYLCAKLDPLPSTALVTACRKRVVRAIEVVASSQPVALGGTAQWRCVVCSKMNEPAMTACAVCKRQKPSAAEPRSDDTIGREEATTSSSKEEGELRLREYTQKNARKARQVEAFSDDIEAVLSKIRSGA